MYAIVAADRNWGIGRDGDQLCYIPADLKRFQALTTGHAVVLGRRTLVHLSGRTAPEGPPEPDPLPGPGLPARKGRRCSGTWSPCWPPRAADAFVIGGDRSTASSWTGVIPSM
ncbi:MAG: dihydrofolate reductase [Intestinimonas sp.]